ncbi:MAG: hypothetical protein CL783_05700 [Chloroflexi bacterium]|nr:hypothetical protein [Chloroflexota bacterium]
MNKIRLLQTLVVLMVTVLTASCHSNQESSAAVNSNKLVVFTTASDVGLGTSRIPLNIRKTDGTPLMDIASEIEVSYSPEESNEDQIVKDLKWREWPIHGGIYTTTMEFSKVGFWNIKVKVNSDELQMSAETGILVKSTAEAPDIGELAPATKTKTSPEGTNLRLITTAPEPDPDLYSISFDEAIKTGRPTVISFSTPAYCRSGACGPQTEVLSELEDQYKNQVNFIHVEIFDNPAEMLGSGDASVGIESPVIDTWNFHTEPWTFTISRSGIVVGRFEGFVTAEEIEESLLGTLDAT